MLHEAESKRLLLAIAEGLRFLHEDCKMIHRDIKSTNIQVRMTGSLCVDWGERS